MSEGSQVEEKERWREEKRRNQIIGAWIEISRGADSGRREAATGENFYWISELIKEKTLLGCHFKEAVIISQLYKMALFDLQREGQYQRNVICRIDGCNNKIDLTILGVCDKCKEKAYEDCTIDGVRFSYCARYGKYKPRVLKMPPGENGYIHPTCNYCRRRSILVPSVEVLEQEGLLPCPTPDELVKYAPRAKIRMLLPDSLSNRQRIRGTGLPTYFAPPPIEPMITSHWGSRRRRSLPHAAAATWCSTPTC